MACTRDTHAHLAHVHALPFTTATPWSVCAVRGDACQGGPPCPVAMHVAADVDGTVMTPPQPGAGAWGCTPTTSTSPSGARWPPARTGAPPPWAPSPAPSGVCACVCVCVCVCSVGTEQPSSPTPPTVGIACRSMMLVAANGTVLTVQEGMAGGEPDLWDAARYHTSQHNTVDVTWVKRACVRVNLGAQASTACRASAAQSSRLPPPSLPPAHGMAWRGAGPTWASWAW
jgi:hypothetical protein